jgi:hypothetical protein
VVLSGGSLKAVASTRDHFRQGDPVHDQSSNQPTFGDAAEREADLAQLKDRLAFYESFDQLIQENISRAGDLLREAAAKRSETELALRTSTAEIERKQLEERVHYRKVFSGLLDQIQTVQQNVERLAREVSDALDDLESVIPAQGELGMGDDELPPLPTFSSSTPGSIGSGLIAGVADAPADAEQATLEPVDEMFPGNTGENSGRDSGAGTSSELSEQLQAQVGGVSPSYADETSSDELMDDGEPIAENVAEIDDFDVSPEEPFAGAESEEDGASSFEPWATANPAVTVEDPEAPGIYPIDEAHEVKSSSREVADSADDWAQSGEDVTTTILVHGVPRATTALSLKRYLEGLAQVRAVEPREYAEGVLRLQVSSDGPIGMDELRGWPEASGMVPVSVDESFVEVKLP